MTFTKYTSTNAPHGPGFIEHWTYKFTQWTGSVYAFALAVLTVLVWVVTGPIFRFSDTWQLVINTGTTIVTFLMVFLIQRSQNKDTLALHLKLNEIVAALEGASNRLIDVEDLSEEEIRRLHARYQCLARAIQTQKEIGHAHSVEEAKLSEAAPESAKGVARAAAAEDPDGSASKS